MKTSLIFKGFLLVSGVIASGIGAAILTAPEAFYASHGVILGADPTLLSEIRAPGGALLVMGLLMLAGVFVAELKLVSLLVAEVVYLSYGLSRLVSMAIDGWPDGGLIQAAAIELTIGSIGLIILLRSHHASPSRPQRQWRLAKTTLGQ